MKGMPSDPEQPVYIFISATTDDVELCKRFEGHLRALGGRVRVWSAHHMMGGDTEPNVTTHEIEKADLILLLFSAAFLADEALQRGEVQRAMERGRCGQARVVPVLVRALCWPAEGFGHLMPLPHSRKAITAAADQEAAWAAVVVEVRRVLDSLTEPAVVSPPPNPVSIAASPPPEVVSAMPREPFLSQVLVAVSTAVVIGGLLVGWRIGLNRMLAREYAAADRRCHSENGADFCEKVKKRCEGPCADGTNDECCSYAAYAYVKHCDTDECRSAAALRYQYSCIVSNNAANCIEAGKLNEGLKNYNAALDFYRKGAELGSIESKINAARLLDIAPLPSPPWIEAARRDWGAEFQSDCYEEKAVDECLMAYELYKYIPQSEKPDDKGRELLQLACLSKEGLVINRRNRAIACHLLVEKFGESDAAEGVLRQLCDDSLGCGCSYFGYLLWEKKKLTEEACSSFRSGCEKKDADSCIFFNEKCRALHCNPRRPCIELEEARESIQEMARRGGLFRETRKSAMDSLDRIERRLAAAAQHRLAIEDRAESAK